MHTQVQSRGFSLVELVIVLGIFSLMVLAAGNFAISMLRSARSVNITLNSNEESRRTLTNIVAELRTASPSSLGAYPLAETSATSLTFYSNIDSDTYKERLRYFVSGTNLKRGVLKPSGSPLTYNSANETVSDAVKGLINTSAIFSYYDNSYNGQTAPLNQPVNVTAIRLIKVNIQADPNPGESPIVFSLSAEVSLRNLKDNL